MTQPTIAPRGARAGPLRELLLLASLCALFFGWRLGHLPLIDPDEPFYALSAREMLNAHDWVVPRIFGHPQFEKPPVVYWMMMSSMATFGGTEAAERLPMAAAATALVFAAYAFGARQFGRRAALIGSVVLATGVEFMVTARMVLTDMIFALFTCSSCFAFWLGARADARRRAWWIAALLCSGLAVLTKGPLGLLVPGLAAGVAWVRRQAPRRIDAATLAAGLVVFAAAAVPWYAVMTHRFGTGFLHSFFVHENWERLIRAEHGVNDRWYYYLGVFVVGSIPWWPSLVAAVTRSRTDSRQDPTVAFLWGWILSSLAFFTLAHSKLPTYVLFAFVPLALLGGRAVANLANPAPLRGAVRGWMRGTAVAQALVFVAAAFVPLLAPVRGVLVVIGLVLAVSVVPLWRGWWTAWVATTATASAALLVALLSSGAPWIESMTSTRDPAAAVTATRAPGEPLLCERSLVRGLTYYSGTTPVVLAQTPHPYFSPHPLPVVVGPEGLGAFVRQHRRALCLVETRTWPSFASGVPRGWAAKRLLGGEKSLFLIEPSGPDAG